MSSIVDICKSCSTPVFSKVQSSRMPKSLCRTTATFLCSKCLAAQPGLPEQTSKKSYRASVLHPASTEMPALSASHTIGSKRFAFGPQKKTPLFQQDVHTKSKVICSDSPRLLRRRVNSPTGSANVAMQNEQPSIHAFDTDQWGENVFRWIAMNNGVLPQKMHQRVLRLLAACGEGPRIQEMMGKLMQRQSIRPESLKEMIATAIVYGNHALVLYLLPQFPKELQSQYREELGYIAHQCAYEKLASDIDPQQAFSKQLHQTTIPFDALQLPEPDATWRCHKHYTCRKAIQTTDPKWVARTLKQRYQTHGPFAPAQMKQLVLDVLHSARPLDKKEVLLALLSCQALLLEDALQIVQEIAGQTDMGVESSQLLQCMISPRYNFVFATARLIEALGRGRPELREEIKQEYANKKEDAIWQDVVQAVSVEDIITLKWIISCIPEEATAQDIAGKALCFAIEHGSLKTAFALLTQAKQFSLISLDGLRQAHAKAQDSHLTGKEDLLQRIQEITR